MVQTRIGSPRIVIFVGRFGSGKTEIAVNYAVALANDRRSSGDHRPVLVDLDIVTPYFRSRETAEAMAALGVEVVAPAAVAQHLDVPAISPRILGAIQDERRPVVLDVGGDEQGARALGQYAPHLERLGYTMNLVVNPYRPFTDTVDGVRAAVADIERTSRVRTTALVSNPNLIGETTVAVVDEGHALVEEAGRVLGLSVAFVAVEEELAPAFGGNHFAQPVLALTRYFTPPWGCGRWQNAEGDRGRIAGRGSGTH